ncbi:MAG TPA: hypothetical protein VMV95_01070 [Bacillota bacterium]|nr:hypothetical protein [Bacillota bacterium]
MGNSKENDEEKIPVDKDFLGKVLKALNDLKEDFDKFKQGSLETPAQPVSISSQPDYIFRCAKTISVSRVPITPEEMVHYKQLDKEFEAELQPLMRKYKVIQLTAMFLKKL